MRSLYSAMKGGETSSGAKNPGSTISLRAEVRVGRQATDDRSFYIILKAWGSFEGL